MIISYASSCTAVENGAAAFEEFCAAHETRQPFDLVLLDIAMPEVNGQEALGAIREYEDECEIPFEHRCKIIMTTAFDDGNNLYHAHASGCTNYIVKPICKKSLIEILTRLGLVRPV